MALINPSGLFDGERLARCSDLAQLHWARLFTASNTFGRIELSYDHIVKTVYGSFKKKPTDKEISMWIEEYFDNFLLFVYEAEDGTTWGQWLTNIEYLSRYHTAADRRSPNPDQKSLEEYRKEYVSSKKSKSIKINRPIKPHETIPTYAVGIGIGIGEGKGEEQGLSSLSPAAPGDKVEKSETATPPLVLTPSPIRPEEFGNTWNKSRGMLPKITDFTDGRKQKVKTRMTNGLTLERFKEAIECCKAKGFLRGENDTGWVANFDWLVANNENVEKAINNPYTGLSGGKNAAVSAGKTKGNMGVLARSLERGKRENSSGQDGVLPAGESGEGPGLPRPVRSVSSSPGPQSVPGGHSQPF